MGLRTAFRRYVGRAEPALSFSEWLSYFSYAGAQYALHPAQTLAGMKEEIESSFTGYVWGAFKDNPVIFACLSVRQLLFSEARFQFRQMRNGRPGDLFGTPALAVLEQPWAGGTTGDLLSRAIQDADLAGNFYATRRGDRVVRLRPDWITIILGGPEGVQPGDIEAEVVGYLYHPGGKHARRAPVSLLPEQVAHFAPIPDPLASYRGMSWLTPVLREIMADTAATRHKLNFFEHGATPNMVVKLSENRREEFEHWVKLFRREHEGVANAYKTLFLGAGADATVVGSNFQQLDFKVTQGAGETRIAAAAGVPPVIVGLSEGLAAATYSNYQLAMRRFADLTMRPLWRNAAGSLSTLVDVPAGAELWYDDRDIPALSEAQKDLAEIQQAHAATIKLLIDAGFMPDDVVSAVVSGDLTRLSHTGLFSVQLQPAGQQVPTGNGPQRGFTAEELRAAFLRAGLPRRLLFDMEE